MSLGKWAPLKRIASSLALAVDRGYQEESTPHRGVNENLRQNRSPRIMGDLRKLGINMAKSTVEKYRPLLHKPPSPTWKAFLNTHMKDLVACDFFTVPTATFRVLFVFIMLAHERRRIVHVNVTEHPTAQWTAQQIVEAFPWDETPRYLLRDRDSIYGEVFQQRV